MRHASFAAFDAARRAAGRRLVLFSTKAAAPYTDFAYRAGDTLLFGRESSGVSAAVRGAADAALRIPLVAGRRSLNVAVAAAMVLGEALRQTGGFPTTPP
jgi:tRNA (cytidine/uridine-2'-O-)-methyltransferase